MDAKLERKIQSNRWLIKSRWYYTLGILLVGFLQWLTMPNIPTIYWYVMIGVLVFYLSANLWFKYFLEYIERDTTDYKIDLFGYVQIMVEILVFIALFHLSGGIESSAMVFFFLPIVSSTLLLGVRGAVLTSFFTSILVIIVIVAEYFEVLSHISPYSMPSVDFLSSKVMAAKTLTYIVFYVVVALFAGYEAKLLIDRENELGEKSIRLNKEKELREDELKQIDKVAKLLVRRDMDLLNTNNELDRKIEQLKLSEKAQLKAMADLQKARHTLEEEKYKTDAIISNFIDPIIVIDRDKSIRLINPAAREIFGLNDSHVGYQVPSKNNYSMHNFHEIIKQDYIVRSAADLKVNDPNIEEVMLKKNGEDLTYKVTTESIMGQDNELLGVMKVFYNLTREKLLDRMKSEFISIAAHQLRTPLSAIKWVIKMVLDEDAGPLNAEQKDMLDKGYKSNERIIALVNDMLNVSRIEEGRLQYSFSKSSYLEVLDIVTDSLVARIEENHLTLKVNKPAGAIPDLFIDKTKMTQVLQNLLENAVKYTPQFGKIEVNITLDDKFVRTSIKDNGVGIPLKDQAKLFGKFFRAENVIRMQTEGSGLGLFIVKNIVEKHGGTIECHSEEGMGTEFVFTLPLEQPAGLAPEPAPIASKTA